MSRLERHQRDWEDLAQLDPLWAIQSSDRNRFGGADDNAFMASGERKVQSIMSRLEEFGLPERHQRALDFGCGIGRLTLPFAERFEHVTGVDIAPAMVEHARERAADHERVRYLVNDRDDLSLLAGEQFDLVYTGLVLQHQPSARVALGYLGELAALVGSGGVLVAQVPIAVPARLRLQHGRRVYSALRRLGVPRDVLYRRLRLQPMRMIAVPRDAVARCLAEHGLRIVSAEEYERDGVRSLMVYAAR
jgi:SAM-dependent methyltransferase